MLICRVLGKVWVEKVEFSTLSGSWYTELISWGCDCKDTEVDLEAKIKMNSCIKCLLLLYFHCS